MLYKVIFTFGLLFHYWSWEEKNVVKKNIYSCMKTKEVSLPAISKKCRGHNCKSQNQNNPLYRWYWSWVTLNKCPLTEKKIASSRQYSEIWLDKQSNILEYADPVGIRIYVVSYTKLYLQPPLSFYGNSRKLTIRRKLDKQDLVTLVKVVTLMFVERLGNTFSDYGDDLTFKDGHGYTCPVSIPSG